MDHYRIYSGDQEVTNQSSGYPPTAEDEAHRLAQEISAGQPGSTVTVVSVSPQPASDWRRIVATYVDGKPHPWLWTVTFAGYLDKSDNARLNRAGITYVDRRSEAVSGGIRGGGARHRLAVEAASDEEAVQKARDALGAKARELTEWTSEPGDGESTQAHEDRQRATPCPNCWTDVPNDAGKPCHQGGVVPPGGKIPTSNAVCTECPNCGFPLIRSAGDRASGWSPDNARKSAWEAAQSERD